MLKNIGVSIASTLCAGLLLWVVSNQLHNTQKLVAIETTLKTYNVTDELHDLERNQNFIWPRLRAHGENIYNMARILEDVCNCDVDIKQPDDF